MAVSHARPFAIATARASARTPSIHPTLPLHPLVLRPVPTQVRFQRLGRFSLLRCKAVSSVGSSKDLYGILRVEKTATKRELKSAYRRLALEYHPDVNDSPDAEEVFKELSAAYEVLYDDEQRSSYDRYGVDLTNLVSTGAARAAWEGFVDGIARGAKKSNKFSRARAAAEVFSMGSDDEVADDAVMSAEDDEGSGGEGNGTVAEPACGQLVRGGHPRPNPRLPPEADLVEYPLASHVRDRNGKIGDTRVQGVGLLINRNKDRGDAAKLPEDKLDLCEVEPLWEEEEGSNEWAIDPLESIHLAMLTQDFCIARRLGEMRVLRAEFRRSNETWCLVDAPSDDGGSPPP